MTASRAWCSAAAATLLFGLLHGCGTSLDSLGNNAGTSGSLSAGASGDPSGGSSSGSSGGGSAGSTAGVSGGSITGAGANAGAGGDANAGASGEATAGAGGDATLELQPLICPASYPNTFKTVLGKADTEITKKLSDAFQQLFHGKASSEAIYIEQGTDQAYVRDFLHTDIRTEGIALAMLISVELDKHDEFDRLWRYAKAHQDTAAPKAGFFDSTCTDNADMNTPCIDVYGMEQFLTALLFASDRWGSTLAMPYATDARALLDQLRRKESINGGVVGGITDVFDAKTKLVREQPIENIVDHTRASLEMPAYYELWGQASGDSFWQAAADAARIHLAAAADKTAGLWPMRSYFNGEPVAGDTFGTEGYRALINVAVDALWGKAPSSETQVADRILATFRSLGLDSYSYSGTFTPGGAPKDTKTTRVQSLIASSGALAVAASNPQNRTDFPNAVWAQLIPTGDSRYYDGILYLTSLLILSGQYRCY